MLQNILLPRKLPLIMIFLALISALVTGVIVYQHAAEAMRSESKAKLYSLLESRESALKKYFKTIRQDVTYHSQGPLVPSAIKEFNAAWKALPNDKTRYLQSHYIKNNPFSLGLKANLLNADDASDYSQTHKKYHSLFINLIAARAYDDVFLIDVQGSIIYSAKKELDFASNLRTGEYRHSNLAEAFANVSQNKTQGFLFFADFASYEPSDGAPASFIAAPIFDEDKHYIGVLAFQMSIDELNNVMQVTAGMGETGETYLVGMDYLMRSDSRFFSSPSILKKRVETTSVKSALAGQEGVEATLDYRNVPVFSAYKSIDFLNTRWAILAEIDEVEVLEPVIILNHFLMISGVIIAVAITVLGYLLAIDLAKPIVTMTNAMNRLARNDLSVNVSVSEREDEVGGMAQALLLFKNSALEREEMRKRLSYLAEYDSLTNLPNRNYAMTYLNKIIETHRETDKRFAVMFADLDGFKSVNDQYGHQIGDKVLKEVSLRFTRNLREKDMVARIGGDEFLLVIPNIQTQEDCSDMADKLVNSLDSLLESPYDQVEIGVSIGIAIFPEHALQVEDLLRVSDDAMYKAKANGKNRYVFSA
ncbi:diguanylate cyclase domain-containing protein [Marinomonas sp. 2405UD68-3]|uniref:diguanylate cyclase domain-containing protein n=1 Tax=Marinomonas sp. 2405UD68-3 TaxID=3391835 RepID=UPI0039C9BFFF